MQITSKKAFIFILRPLSDKLTVNKAAEKVHVHPTEAGTVVNVPDWVREDRLFKLAVQGGDIMEVEVKSGAPASTQAKSESAKSLDKMNKEELVEHAKTVGAEHAPEFTKAQIIDAINQAAQKAAAGLDTK